MPESRISIITPSLNQGAFIAANIESVLAQDYPNLEHIVVDGGSTDQTGEILAQYGHLKILGGPDEGHADAINKGFAQATGSILAFLNADDTLEPGTLARVADEISPGQGRHVVMGRCRFIDEEGRFVGIEHPSHFKSHLRVLQVWKGHMLPQPAIFWTQEVWQRCGPMDTELQYAWIDYDFFCRVSRRFRFHFIDQVFASYRLHSVSKTESVTELRRLEEAIEISRRYWGVPWDLRRWWLALSLWRYRLNRVARGRELLVRARQAYQQRRLLEALGRAVPGALLAPEVIFSVALYPLLRRRVLDRLSPWLTLRALEDRGPDPRTIAHLEYRDRWDDGWVGPTYTNVVAASKEANRLHIKGWSNLELLAEPLVLTVMVDGIQLGQAQIDQSGEFEMDFPMASVQPAAAHSLELRSSTYFVPDRLTRNGDFRPLSFKLTQADFA